MATCLYRHLGFGCMGQVVPGPRLPGRCPICGAQQGCNLEDDNQLPPCIGEAMRDTTLSIQRRAAHHED